MKAIKTAQCSSKNLHPSLERVLNPRIQRIQKGCRVQIDELNVNFAQATWHTIMATGGNYFISPTLMGAVEKDRIVAIID